MSEERARFSRRRALVLYLLAGVGLFVAPLLVGLFGGADANLLNLVNNLLYYLPFTALPIALSLRRRPQLLEALRPNPISPRCALLLVVMALMCMMLANEITLLWCIPLQRLGLNVDAGNLSVPADMAGLMICVFYVAVLPGVFEEFLFRGAMLSAFEEWGTSRAILITSLLFMLLHGSPVGAPAQLMMGVLLAMAVVYTGSIYAGLILHTTYNAASVILQFLQDRAPAADAAPPADYLAAIGGAPGVAAILTGALLLGIALWFCLRLLRLRARLRGVELVAQRAGRLSGGEWALLIAGLAVVALLYGVNVYWMLL